jgi:hypothetical protein
MNYLERRREDITRRKGTAMHYRNGREAKNGDKIVQISGYGSGAEINAVGVLYDAKPSGGDTCNGNIAPIQSPLTSACLCDCLHVDDLGELLTKAGLDKRPAGK